MRRCNRAALCGIRRSVVRLTKKIGLHLAQRVLIELHVLGWEAEFCVNQGGAIRDGMWSKWL